MTKMMKIADSAAIRANIPTWPRDGSCHERSAPCGVAVIADYSYLQSGSSGCLRSQRGRRLLTAGMDEKLYAGGGDVVDHSSVQASHGSLPARLRLKYDQRRLATKTR